MTKTKLLLLALCAIALMGCENTESNRLNPSLKNDYDMRRRYFDGHYYITCVVRRGGGITHDPDCQCREKGGEE